MEFKIHVMIVDCHKKEIACGFSLIVCNIHNHHSKNHVRKVFKKNLMSLSVCESSKLDDLHVICVYVYNGYKDDNDNNNDVLCSPYMM